MAQALTSDEERVLRAVWSLPDAAAFDYGHLLVNQAPPELAAMQLGWAPDEIERTLASAMGKLRGLRRDRSLPVDDKVLAGWNALAMEAFIAGARQSGKAIYAQTATLIKAYIETVLWDGDQLFRAISGGSALGTVSLSDYALTARAMLAFSRWANSPGDAELAHQIVLAAWGNFHRSNGWQRERDPLLKGSELHEVLRDEAMPAGDAILIEASLELAREMNLPGLTEMARSALNRFWEQLRAEAFLSSRIRALEVAIGAQKGSKLREKDVNLL